jgi:hypothetical protein
MTLKDIMKFFLSFLLSFMLFQSIIGCQCENVMDNIKKNEALSLLNSKKNEKDLSEPLTTIDSPKGLSAQKAENLSNDLYETSKQFSNFSTRKLVNKYSKEKRNTYFWGLATLGLSTGTFFSWKYKLLPKEATYTLGIASLLSAGATLKSGYDWWHASNILKYQEEKF